MNINELDNIFIDEDGKSWRNIRSKGYVIANDNKPPSRTLIPLSTDKLDQTKPINYREA